MTEPEMTTRAAASRCSIICWVPPVMLILAYCLGVCSLFFMSFVGLILCIFQCIFGTFAALLAFGAGESGNKRLVMGAVFFSSVYILILAFTFVSAASLLRRHVQAQKDYNRGDSSPLITPLLDMYVTQSVDSSSFDKPINTTNELSSIDEFQTSEGQLDSASSVTALSTQPVLGTSSIASRSTQSSVGEGTQEHDQDSITTGTREHPDVSPVKMMTLMTLRNVQINKEIESPEDFPPNPTHTQQGWDPTNEMLPTNGDLICLRNIVADEQRMVDTARRFESLLDWSLFCGFTKYSVGPIHKWPYSCEKFCLLDRLGFSSRRREMEINRQADAFMRAVSGMDQFRAEICSVLTIVTACIIEEHNLVNGVFISLIIALFLSFVLLLLNIACLIACLRVSVEKGNQVSARR